MNSAEVSWKDTPTFEIEKNAYGSRRQLGIWSDFWNFVVNPQGEAQKKASDEANKETIDNDNLDNSTRDDDESPDDSLIDEDLIQIGGDSDTINSQIKPENKI